MTPPGRGPMTSWPSSKLDLEDGGAEWVDEAETPEGQHERHTSAARARRREGRTARPVNT